MDSLFLETSQNPYFPSVAESNARSAFPVNSAEEDKGDVKRVIVK